MTAKYTPEQTRLLRAEWLEQRVLPQVNAAFRKHPSLRSAAMLVAQYWNDEADDAVHAELLFSELPQVDITAAYAALNGNEVALDELNLPSALDHWALHFEYSERLRWDSNHDAIPLFAAYCKEGCNQCMDHGEAYSPYAVFRRASDLAPTVAGPAIEPEIVGAMLRPWLDGVRPQWDA